MTEVNTANITLNLPEHLTPDMREALLMLAGGAKLREIKAKTGVAPSRVSLEARVNGIERGVFTEARDAVYAVLSGGMTVKEASEAYDIPAYRIYYAIRRQSGVLKPRESGPRYPERYDQMANMRLDGGSLNEIGKKYQISRQRVHQILKTSTLYNVVSAQRAQQEQEEEKAVIAEEHINEMMKDSNREF